MRAFVVGCCCLFLLVAGLVEVPAAPVGRVPAVFAAYATPLEEPWNMVIHEALTAAQKAGRISYTWQDKLAGERPMAEGIRAALAKSPDLVVADLFEGDAAVRALAAAHPRTEFLVATAGPPAPPNLSVFDNDLSEPAYLCGVVAGRLTKSNVVGVVAGKSEAEVHRTVHAYIRGARDANPAVKVRVAFIGSWYDPPKARQAALDQIASGADLIYAEREGAIAAAREKGVLAFGNLVDQHAEAPETVITGPVWSMAPLVDHVVKQVTAGMLRGEDLRDFSCMSRGGTMLASWHAWGDKLPSDVLELVREKQNAIKTGALQLPDDTSRPTGD